jgi:hypothetical protein
MKNNQKPDKFVYPNEMTTFGNNDDDDKGSNASTTSDTNPVMKKKRMSRVEKLMHDTSMDMGVDEEEGVVLKGPDDLNDGGTSAIMMMDAGKYSLDILGDTKEKGFKIIKDKKNVKISPQKEAKKEVKVKERSSRLNRGTAKEASADEDDIKEDDMGGM